MTKDVHFRTSGMLQEHTGLVRNFVHEGHPIEVKVTGDKKVENSYSCNVKF